MMPQFIFMIFGGPSYDGRLDYCLSHAIRRKD